jgi:hypothetical protein
MVTVTIFPEAEKGSGPFFVLSRLKIRRLKRGQDPFSEGKKKGPDPF